MTAVHPIFQAILNGQFAEGLALHRQHPLPTPEDDRWAGYCLYVLGQLMEAKDLLLRATGRGCAAAGAELVTVLRSLGDVQAANAALNTLLHANLAPTDRAYALRESAALHLNSGQVRRAVTALEEAWTLLSGRSGAAEALQVQTAQQLGYAYHLLGRNTPARHYLEFALSRAEGARRLHPLMTRAQVHLYAGHYDRSHADLAEAGTLLTAGARPYHAYLTALLARAQGRWEEALRAFLESAAAARETGERSTEFLAELGASTVFTVQGDAWAARLHLQRASQMHETPWEEALFRLRQGYLLGATGQPEAEAQLRAARLAFGTLDLPRETAWAELHLAELAADRHEGQALEAVGQAMLQRSALESGASLLPELRLLPRLSALMRRRWQEPNVARLLAERRQVLGDAPMDVRFLTLGPARIEVDGQPIRLGLRRTPELIAFLLCRGPSGRDAVLAALWPDDDPRRARNYLHQAIFALKEALPALQIVYDRHTRLYRPVCEGPTFFWDAGFIKRALSADDEHERQRAVLAYSAPFLQDVDSEWAREERDALSFSVITVGLKLIRRWSAEGEYLKCADLSRRLLAVDPGDEALAEYLVEAVLELEGLAAAQRALSEVSARAERELDVRPPWVDRLSRRLQTALN